MPGRIFHILWIDRLVEFKLLCALFVFAGIIVSDAALPMFGGPLGLQLKLSIEVGDGFRDSNLSKTLFAAQLQNSRG
jgi:hypothetical protein